MIHELSPNQIIEIHILFPSIEGDYSKLVIQFLDLWVWEINVGSKNWSKLGEDTRINIDLKMKTESQGSGSWSHSHLSSISMNGELAKPRFGIGQVQICVMKLSLDQSLQDTKILRSYQ